MAPRPLAKFARDDAPLVAHRFNCLARARGTFPQLSLSKHTPAAEFAQIVEDRTGIAKQNQLWVRPIQEFDPLDWQSLTWKSFVEGWGAVSLVYLFGCVVGDVGWVAASCECCVLSANCYNGGQLSACVGACSSLPVFFGRFLPCILLFFCDGFAAPCG